jgi:hypothetical protein
MAEVIACSACGGLFTPKRSTARFCTSRCRVLAHRGRRVGGPARAIRRPVGSFLSVTGGTPPLVPKSTPVTLKPLCQNKSLPDGIVPDQKWPGMYRIRLPDGGLSDMINLTRVKDAIRRMQDHTPGRSECFEGKDSDKADHESTGHCRK